VNLIVLGDRFRVTLELYRRRASREGGGGKILWRAFGKVVRTKPLCGGRGPYAKLNGVEGVLLRWAGGL
jgi:hypothetical protein